MKRILYLIILLFVVAACNHSENITIKEQISWEDALAKMMHQTKSSTNKLVLLDYKIRHITSNNQDIEAALSEIFDDNAFMAIGTIDKHMLVNLKDYKVPLSKSNDSYTSLNDIFYPGMKVIDLLWEYNGESHQSVALASDDLFFDLIFSHLIDESASRRVRTDTVESGNCVSSNKRW